MTQFKAVLLDMVMPKKSGDQAFLEMKKIDPHIREWGSLLAYYLNLALISVFVINKINFPIDTLARIAQEMNFPLERELKK